MTPPQRPPLQGGPFVSYAREDQPFVRRLHEALERRQRDTWVDWEDIYPTEEWMARIRSAIDAAQAFVFVISPHSVASPVCGEELAHAVKQGKRLIPVVAADVDAAAVPPAVAKLNWLQFRGPQDFDSQVDALVAAMDLDVGWLRDHTRLLVRAEEWQKRDRDASLLLRGTDLKAAEQWLLRADTANDRIPTPVQTQFIVASRQADTRRRNLQRTIAMAAAVVLAALSIYAWVQKTVAERQRNLAISRQLAARVATVSEDDGLARLLVSALATRYSHSPEADASLAKSLVPTPPLVRVLWSPSHDDSIGCLSFHRDGAFAAASNTHGVTVWRLETGQIEAFLAADDGVDCVVFGPRDDLVAISDEGRVILWDWREGRTRMLGGDLNHETTRSAFSADGRSVLVASLGQVVRWDIDRAASAVVISQSRGSYHYAFAANGARLAAADESRHITVWDLENGQTLAEMEGPQGAGMVLAVSPDGRTIAAGRDSIAIWDVDSQGPHLLKELNGQPVTVALAFSADGETLAAAGIDGAIVQWQFRRGQPLPVATAPFASSLAFTADNEVLAAGAGRGSVRLMRRANRFAHVLQRPVDGEILSEESAGDGSMIVLRRGRGVVAWNPSRGGEPVNLGEFPDRQNAMHISPHGRVLAVLDGDGAIGLWDVETGRRTGHVKPAGVVERIDVSATGALIAGVDIDGGIVVMDSGGASTWSKGSDATDHARSVAFSPDERRVASGGLDGDIHLWDARTGEHQAAFNNGPGNVLAVAFSPDGRELAATHATDIVLWDLAAAQPRRTIRGHASRVFALAYSPDGSRLASGSFDQTARIWNTLSGDELLRLDESINASNVMGVAFSRDGRTLATRTASRRVDLWDVNGDHWTALACGIVNRNLSREEWDRFLPSEPYRAACPSFPAPFPPEPRDIPRPAVRMP